MKKITLFSFIILLFSASLFSKAGFKIGVGAGLNLAKIKEKYYSDANSNMLGFDAAIPMEIKLSKYFAIQPEIHFIEKGFSLKYYGVNNIDKIFRRRIYIETPVNFKGIIPVNDKSSFNMFIGFGAGYALTNKQVTKFEGGEKHKEKFPYDNNVDDDNIAYRRYDLVMPLGVGYEYKINDKIAIYTDIRFNLDLNNNIQYKTKPDPTPRYKYRNFLFSVGMFFIAKDK